MNKILLNLLLLFSLVGNLYGQDQLNAYKYMIVKKQYAFQKSENQYRLNSILKHKFDQRGFTTAVNGETYPDDLHKNPCLGVTAELEDVSNILVLKLQMHFKDCHDKTVYQTIIGRSKEKFYEDAYKEALNKLFASIDSLNYGFDPMLHEKAENIAVQAETTPTVVAQKDPVEESAQETVQSDREARPTESINTEMAVVTTAAIATEPDAAEIQTKAPEVNEEEAGTVIANSYSNENISFFLIEQEGKMKAYVNKSKNKNYKKGEMIGTFEKTSLPQVFQVRWKKNDQDIDETTAYFDKQGNLRVDIRRNGELETLTFKKEK